MHLYATGVAYRFTNGAVRKVPAGERDRILPAANLLAVLPYRHHIVGVVLDQS